MITKAKAVEVNRDVRAALEAVANKHGLTVVINGGSFNGGSFKPRVEFKDAGGQAQIFESTAVLYGLKPEDLGRQFQHCGQTFEICGINARSRRFPIEARRLEDGKVYRFQPSAVRS